MPAEEGVVDFAGRFSREFNASELAARTPRAMGLREIAAPMVQLVQSQVRQHTQLGVGGVVRTWCILIGCRGLMRL